MTLLIRNKAKFINAHILIQLRVKYKKFSKQIKCKKILRNHFVKNLGGKRQSVWLLINFMKPC